MTEISTQKIHLIALYVGELDRKEKIKRKREKKREKRYTSPGIYVP